MSITISGVLYDLAQNTKVFIFNPYMKNPKLNITGVFIPFAITQNSDYDKFEDRSLFNATSLTTPVTFSTGLSMLSLSFYP